MSDERMAGRLQSGMGKRRYRGQGQGSHGGCACVSYGWRMERNRTPRKWKRPPRSRFASKSHRGEPYALLSPHRTTVSSPCSLHRRQSEAAGAPAKEKKEKSKARANEQRTRQSTKKPWAHVSSPPHRRPPRRASLAGGRRAARAPLPRPLRLWRGRAERGRRTRGTRARSFGGGFFSKKTCSTSRHLFPTFPLFLPLSPCFSARRSAGCVATDPGSIPPAARSPRS